ncbi:MAG TPA: C-type lectin domain-containing protein, partial [Polyangiaceae bacterium]|nr:C-type lectin domain-containing protein [Polyangiaceae bacterium]
MTQSTSKIFDGARRVLAIAAVVLLGGCQVQNELTDAPLSLAGEQCEDGETRECGRTLAQHDDVLSCLHGVQRCEGGTWTECADGTIHQFAANETPVRPSTELSSLGDAVNCQYSPCDPYCRNYVESPEDGITTTVGGGTGTGWLTGSLTNVPPGFAKKAIADTCSTAADCQMNTYCRFPDNGSCGHSKCAVGEALEDSCDPCVADICETSPECCQQEKPAACEHDPCAVGDALVANCSSCTTKICAAMPECCSGSWTAACVAAVATICEQTCGCCGGEQGFGGRCYNLETDTQKWDHALSGCEDRTSSGAWNMVAINDQAENDFVQGLNGGLATWIGLEQGDGVTENQWLWTSGDPAGIWLESTGLGVYDNFAAGQPSGSDDCAVMNASGGTWAAASCNDKYNRLCEGPPECIDGSPTVACSHDPCLQGAALADGCDSCVDRICDAMPSCCNTAWTAECVAAVATTCGNTCGCAAGEVARDGRCYFQDETDRTWSAARTSCQARGTGWDIATLTDSA